MSTSIGLAANTTGSYGIPYYMMSSSAWGCAAATTSSATYTPTQIKAAMTAHVNSMPASWSNSWGHSLADCEEEWWGGARHPSKKLVPGQTYDLPDGSKIKLEVDGKWRIDDSNAKVVYKANNLREFSPHLNASDMVAKFVEYVATLGVKRKDVMGLPINLFISWLIIEAAKRDGDSIPSDVVPVQDDPSLRLAAKPKCLACGRYIPRLHFRENFLYCTPEHAGRHLAWQRNQTARPARSAKALSPPPGTYSAKAITTAK